eukprot:scaffold116404_cov72-Phaeocystis_antarctica.AAC.2
MAAASRSSSTSRTLRRNEGDTQPTARRLQRLRAATCRTEGRVFYVCTGAFHKLAALGGSVRSACRAPPSPAALTSPATGTRALTGARPAASAASLVQAAASASSIRVSAVAPPRAVAPPVPARLMRRRRRRRRPQAAPAASSGGSARPTPSSRKASACLGRPRGVPSALQITTAGAFGAGEASEDVTAWGQLPALGCVPELLGGRRAEPHRAWAVRVRFRGLGLGLGLGLGFAEPHRACVFGIGFGFGFGWGIGLGFGSKAERRVSLSPVDADALEEGPG